jgi:prepilin-type N-terminal cleavage/methylation domain-containing protein
MNRIRRNKSNFTLVEIIAVLIIIGIMAAVATPKFLSLAEEAKRGVAQAGLNEAKAALSVAVSKAFLAAGGDADSVDAANVLAALNIEDEDTIDFGDVTVTFTVSGTDIALNAEHESTYATDTFSWDVGL